jgi:hypothetical protein
MNLIYSKITISQLDKFESVIYESNCIEEESQPSGFGDIISEYFKNETKAEATVEQKNQKAVKEKEALDAIKQIVLDDKKENKDKGQSKFIIILRNLF